MEHNTAQQSEKPRKQRKGAATERKTAQQSEKIEKERKPAPPSVEALINMYSTTYKEGMFRINNPELVYPHLRYVARGIKDNAEIILTVADKYTLKRLSVVNIGGSFPHYLDAQHYMFHAMKEGSRDLIFARRKTSEDLTPDLCDMEFARFLGDACRSFGTFEATLFDYIIFNEERYFSFVKENLLFFTEDKVHSPPRIEFTTNFKQ